MLVNCNFDYAFKEDRVLYISDVMYLPPILDVVKCSCQPLYISTVVTTICIEYQNATQPHGTSSEAWVRNTFPHS